MNTKDYREGKLWYCSQRYGDKGKGYFRYTERYGKFDATVNPYIRYIPTNVVFRCGIAALYMIG